MSTAAVAWADLHHGSALNRRKLVPVTAVVNAALVTALVTARVTVMVVVTAATHHTLPAYRVGTPVLGHLRSTRSPSLRSPTWTWTRAPTRRLRVGHVVQVQVQVQVQVLVLVQALVLALAT
jgi:hypothetical protein